jgi:hypothetical protein
MRRAQVNMRAPFLQGFGVVGRKNGWLTTVSKPPNLALVAHFGGF